MPDTAANDEVVIDLPNPVEYRDDEFWTAARRLGHLLHWLITHEDNVDQNLWIGTTDEQFTLPAPGRSCGTQACAAGWIVLFAGAKPYDFRPENAYTRLHATASVLKTWEAQPESRDVTVSRYAADLLGLTRDEAREAFRSCDLAALVEALQDTTTGEIAIAQGYWQRRYFDDDGLMLEDA